MMPMMAKHDFVVFDSSNSLSTGGKSVVKNGGEKKKKVEKLKIYNLKCKFVFYRSICFFFFSSLPSSALARAGKMAIASSQWEQDAVCKEEKKVKS